MANVLPNQDAAKRRRNMRIIDSRADLLDSFGCRRNTISRKVTQLAHLTEAEVALIVYGPDNRLYHYGSPSIDALMERYRNVGDINPCMAARGSLDLNKPPPPPPMETIVEPKDIKSGPYNWRGDDICGMNSHELRSYIVSLQAKWKDAEAQLGEVQKRGC